MFRPGTPAGHTFPFHPRPNVSRELLPYEVCDFRVDGKMVWNGTVQGSDIEATADWYNKEGKFVKKYWVKGKLKR